MFVKIFYRPRLLFTTTLTVVDGDMDMLLNHLRYKNLEILNCKFFRHSSLEIRLRAGRPAWTTVLRGKNWGLKFSV